MAAFEPKFRAAMQSRVRLLDQIMGYIVRRKGTQMRPMFVFLSARLCHGPTGALPEATYRGAALIELLHTATLVHDDVVDEANYRRGFFSINALWKNKIAVLVGDYLLSKGLLLSIDHGDFELLRLVSAENKNAGKNGPRRAGLYSPRKWPSANNADARNTVRPRGRPSTVRFVGHHRSSRVSRNPR